MRDDIQFANSGLLSDRLVLNGHAQAEYVGSRNEVMRVQHGTQLAQARHHGGLAGVGFVDNDAIAQVVEQRIVHPRFWCVHERLGEHSLKDRPGRCKKIAGLQDGLGRTDGPILL